MRKHTIRYYDLEDYSDRPYNLKKLPIKKQNQDSKSPNTLPKFSNTYLKATTSKSESFNSYQTDCYQGNGEFIAKKSVSVSTRYTDGYQAIVGCSSDIGDESLLSDREPRMDWNNYHRLNVIYSFMNDLELNFPSICTVGSIGKSLEGRDIKAVKISNSQSSNVSVWMDAGIHAREWIAPAVATYMANYIASNFDSLPANMMNKDWYILPVLNPDGYEYTHTNERLWRKNRAWWKGQCVGVDLNRNFSFGWGGKGSSDNPSNGFFRGSRPFSEPESCAVRDMLLNPKINFKIYLTLHSFGQVIIFPFACRDDLCPSYVRLLEGATAMSKAIYEKTGNIYKVGISKDVMYTASGTSNDFSHGVANIPFCYLIELRSKKHKFKLPKEEIAVTCAEILSSIKALMEVVDKYDITRVIDDDAIEKVSINIWREEESIMDIMVEGQQRLTQIASILHERDIPYSISMKDVNTLVQKEKEEVFKKVAIKMDWKSYHRLSVIYDFMERLAEEYPFLCKVNVIGKSVENRDIKMLKISNGDANNEAVWLDGAIHPREWISVAVVTFIADKIVRHYNELPTSVTAKDWYIVPVLNPDGYEYTHTHDRMWRKNRARYGECIGVDLNRNFSVGWGEKGEDGSSDDPGSIYFRGTQAFSEPEAHAVKSIISHIGAAFKVFLSFHSYGEVILFPWGYTSDACPNYVELLEGGIVMAKAIHETSGHIYKVGSTKDLMYYTAGNSIDWSYGKANIPFSYMIELRSKKHKFLLPKEEIIPTAKEITCAVMRLMDFVDQRSKSNNATPK